MAEIISNAEDETDGDGEYEIETEVKAWVSAAADREAARAEACGTRTLKLTVKNCGVVRGDGRVVNRVEVDTGFNFDTVKQILLSPPTSIPVKAGYSLRFVVLSTGKPIVLLLPYVFEDGLAGNAFKHWEFVNSDLKSSRHQVAADID